MRYAICNETFGDWPFPKAFACARECGYTGIEVAPFTLAPDASSVTPQQRDEVKNQIADAGLECVGLHWLLAKTEGYYLTTPDDTIRNRTGDYLATLAQLCADLDGKIMVLGSPQQRNLLPGVTHEEGLDLAAAAIRRAIPVMEDLGVTLALEPLSTAEGDFLNTAASGIELAERVDSPNCRLHLDVKAMSAEEQPIGEIIRSSRDWITHFHANDPNLLGPGMGEVEFEPVVAALKEIDYQGWVSVEVFRYEPGIETICEESIRYLREMDAKT
ncbi:MAG: sugar phosphate isomerase/epimerase family protein [Verrucomicrobiota bacterium]